MKRTKMLLIAVFMLAIGSAFTTKNMHQNFLTVLSAPKGTTSPCTNAPAVCGANGGICTDVTNTIEYFDPNHPGCTVPLQMP
jgi:Family of unknown function (DUF6520)